MSKVAAPVGRDSPEWQNAAAQELTMIPTLHTLPRKTTVRLLYSPDALFVRAEAEIGDGKDFPALARDRVLTNQEAFDIYLAPQPTKEVFYRFTAGANAASKYDAVSGLIADVMDPRYAKDDPTWNGEWTSETRVDAKARVWTVLVTIPFKTLGAEAPVSGVTWRANFGRNHLLPRQVVDRAIWSSSAMSASMDDRAVFGEVVFR